MPVFIVLNFENLVRAVRRRKKWRPLCKADREHGPSILPFSLSFLSVFHEHCAHDEAWKLSLGWSKLLLDASVHFHHPIIRPKIRYSNSQKC
jgi:hypothetical protein